jgi:hypothetical protein
MMTLACVESCAGGCKVEEVLLFIDGARDEDGGGGM